MLGLQALLVAEVKKEQGQYQAWRRAENQYPTHVLPSQAGGKMNGAASGEGSPVALNHQLSM